MAVANITSDPGAQHFVGKRNVLARSKIGVHHTGKFTQQKVWCCSCGTRNSQATRGQLGRQELEETCTHSNMMWIKSDVIHGCSNFTAQGLGSELL